MIGAQAAIPRPTAGLNERTRAWAEATNRTEGMANVFTMDALMWRASANENWIAVDGELLLTNGRTRENSLTGLKGMLLAGTAIDHGVLWVPLYGVRAKEGEVNCFVDLGILASAWPGVALNGHSIGGLLTSNIVGIFNDAGASGTAGTWPIMFRGSGGFKGGVWLAAGQSTHGGSVAAGWSMGSRTGATGAFGRSGGVVTDFAQPVIALPNQNVNLLSAEPSTGNSLNWLAAFWLGATMSKPKAAQQDDDILNWIRQTGVWAQVSVSPLVLGENCFTTNSLQQVIPPTLKIRRQRQPPDDDHMSGAAYIGYPLTGAMARFFVSGVKTGPTAEGYLVANPFTTTAGSPVITVAHVAHGLIAGRDVLEYSGATPGAGLADADINRRFIVETTPTADTYTVRTGTNATGGTFGGATCAAAYRLFRDQTTTFSFPRDSELDCFVWSPRGDRATPDGPINKSRRPNSTEGAPIARRTALGELPAGLECRPGYTLHRLGAGACVVQFMFVANVLPRNDTRITTLWDGNVRPAGWGYLDVAEKYGLDPAKVIHWREAYVRADELFTVAVENYATSYDYVLLQNGTMANVPNQPTAKKGIVIDLEHADGRAPDLLEEMFFDCNATAAALGFTFCWLGHYLTPPQGPNNGFTKDNIRRIQQMSNFRGHNIIAIRRANAAAAEAWCQAQADMTRGPNDDQPIDYSKFVLSLTLARGDAAVPLDQCAAIRAWYASRGIDDVHIRRAAQFEGGVAEHEWNQQQITYLPNLLARPPQTAQGVVEAWVSAIVSLGGTAPGIPRQGLMLDLINPLFEAAIWDELDIFTVFANESNLAARVDLRRLQAGTLVSTASLVVDRWLLVDGVSGYYDHGIPPSSALSMTGPDQMIAVYRHEEPGVGSVYGAGTLVNAAMGQALRVNADNAVTAGQVQIVGAAGFENTSTSVFAEASTTHYVWAQKRAGRKQLGRFGTMHVDAAITTNNDTLVNRNLFSGANNSNGTPGGFKAGKHLATVTGKSQTAARHALIGQCLTNYFVAVGALPPPAGLREVNSNPPLFDLAHAGDLL